MFNPGLFLNSRPDGFGVLEILESETAPPRFVPLTKTVLQGEVMGPFADLRLTQHFRFAAESWPKPVEALYRFPLPGDAAVTGATVTFGDVRIKATLASREEAEAQYAEAKAAGKQAALATREAPDVFTLMVAGIRPDQEVRVETSFVLLARRDGPDWTMRIPLTTAPRYVANRCVGPFLKVRQRELFVRIDHIDQVVWDLSLLGLGGLGGADVHSPVYLPGIRRNDLAIQCLCQLNGQ